MVTFNSKTDANQILEGKDLTGRNVLITGGTDGIGLENYFGFICNY